MDRGRLLERENNKGRKREVEIWRERKKDRQIDEILRHIIVCPPATWGQYNTLSRELVFSGRLLPESVLISEPRESACLTELILGVEDA